MNTGVKSGCNAAYRGGNPPGTVPGLGRIYGTIYL